MNKKFALSCFLVMVMIVGLLFCATPGQAAPVNIGFETGDISGWTIGYIMPGGSVNVLPYKYTNDAFGNQFLQLNNAMVSQTFTLDANQTIS
jgi:hypothetical protein